MKKQFQLLASLLALASLSNCIAVRSSQYSAVKTEELKVVAVKKSKIFIDTGFHIRGSNNLPQNFVDKAKSDQKKMFSEAIKESDCCELIDEKEEANIVVDANFYREPNKLVLAACFISGFTFTAIPCWGNARMEVSAKVSKNKMVKDYDIKDSVFMAFWAPLIIATPFNKPMLAEAEVNKNFYKSIIVQMKKDGFFGK